MGDAVHRSTKRDATSRKRVAAIAMAAALVWELGISYCEATPCGASHSCQAGDCYFSASTDRSLCLCPPGRSGWDCGTQISICTVDCNMPKGFAAGSTCASVCGSGKCINTSSDPYYRCECDNFSSGVNCEINSNPCVSQETNPCGQGECEFIAGVNRVICNCYDGWSQPTGVPNSELSWPSGSTFKVEVPPGCTVKKSYGIAGVSGEIVTGELVTWWVVFAALLLVLMWCCFGACTDCCSKNLQLLKGLFTQPAG